MKRIHPLPVGTNRALVDVFGSAVAGAVRSALDAHAPEMSNHQKGMLVGSIRKRAINQLLSDEGERRIRDALGDRQSYSANLRRLMWLRRDWARKILGTAG